MKSIRAISLALVATLLAATASVSDAPPATALTYGETAANWARANLVGVPYEWGGRELTGFDCSGSVYMAWNVAKPGHVSDLATKFQYDGSGTKIFVGRNTTLNSNSLLAGDLIFWSYDGTVGDIYHFAIYLGAGQVLQASSGKNSWLGGINDNKDKRMEYALRPVSGSPLPTLGVADLATRGQVATWMFRQAEVGEFHAVTPHDEARDMPYSWMTGLGVAGLSSPAGVQTLITRVEFAAMAFAAFADPAYVPASPRNIADVQPSHPQYRAVQWLIEKGVTATAADTNYGVDLTMSKKTVVTMLYRIADSPARPAASPQRYSDVSTADPFAPAADWIYRERIATGPFPDVVDEGEFGDEIRWLRDTGISTGYDDGTFKPGNNVTRQALAAMLHRIAGEPHFDAPDSPTFNDVPVDHPFFYEIEWMAANGISEGYPDGGFHPTALVTRQAMAAFLQRMSGQAAPTVHDEVFGDVAADHPFAAEILWMKNTGVSNGYGDGTFGPGNNLTRQAIAAFLFRYDQRFGT